MTGEELDIIYKRLVANSNLNTRDCEYLVTSLEDAWASNHSLATRNQSAAVIIQNQQTIIEHRNQQIEHLKRIIAKELTENDELGSEYVYVMALKEDIQAKDIRIARLEEAIYNAGLTIVEGKS